MAAFDFRLTGINDEDIQRAGGSLPLWASLPGAEPAACLLTAGGPQPADATQVDEAELAHWAASPHIARPLLAAAYQAIASGEPFLLVAEPAFAYGWVRFLWLTLPPAWAGHVPFLSYARAPLDWAPSPGQPVIAGVPEELMAALMPRTRWLSRPAQGEFLSEGQGPYLLYAEHVVGFLSEHSTALLDLRARIDALLPHPVPPTAGLVALLPLAASLALGDPLPLPPGDLPAGVSALYRPEDLPLLPPEDLVRLVLLAPALRPALWNELATAAQTVHSLGQALPAARWDAWVRDDAPAAIHTLLVLSHWESWHQTTQLDPPARRRAAQAWCASDYWDHHEPFFEHWKSVVRDLAWLPTSELALKYPQIEWFAQEQIEDLAKLPRQDPGASPPPPARTPINPAPIDWVPFEDPPAESPGLLGRAKKLFRWK